MKYLSVVCISSYEVHQLLYKSLLLEPLHGGGVNMATIIYNTTIIAYIHTCKEEACTVSVTYTQTLRMACSNNQQRLR